MPSIPLIVDLFDESMVDHLEIQGFECGSDPWCLFAESWIKGTSQDGQTAISSIANPKFETEVWLYWSETRRLVGFCGLGKTTWRLTGAPEVVSIIPQFAIHSDFQKQGISYDILGDILAKAADHGTRFLVLQVHENNGAIQLYKKLRFHELPDRKRKDHIAMVRINREPAGS